MNLTLKRNVPLILLLAGLILLLSLTLGSYPIIAYSL